MIKHPGNPRLTIGLAGALICIFLLSGSVQTYYDDTHYGLTYYMARSCGYTGMQAYRIASADVSVDTADLTEPVQKRRMAEAAAVGSVAEVVVNSADPLRGDFQEPRVKFHAFRDARPVGRMMPTQAAIQLADDEIKKQENTLRGLAARQRNPGVLLHFIQDESSHKGYTSLGGHWASSSNSAVSTLAAPDLPEGATTDYLQHDETAARNMISATIGALRRFMAEMPTTQRPAACTLAAIADVPDAKGRPILNLLMEANNVHSQPAQYVRQLPDAVGNALGVGPGAPDATIADGVVRAKLGSQEVYPYANHNYHIPYEFDRDGNVTNLPVGIVSGSLETLSSAANPLDGLTLYGNLRVKLGGPGATGRPAQVSVWAAPTRKSEVPYQLDCQTETAGSAEFFNLPVGDIIIQAVMGNVVTKQRITLNRLMQNEVLNLPASDRVADNCSQPVEPDKFTQACMISRGTMARRMAGAAMNDTSIGQMQKAEAPIQGLVNQEGSCLAQSPDVAGQKKAAPAPPAIPPTPLGEKPDKAGAKSAPGGTSTPGEKHILRSVLIGLTIGAAAGAADMAYEAKKESKDCGPEPAYPKTPTSSSIASFVSAMKTYCSCYKPGSTYVGDVGCVK
jgi:hypothetical protein